MSKAKLGPFEEEVLTLLRDNRTDAYGLRLIDLIKQSTGRSPSIGAMYTTLDRLERKGLVRSRWGEATPERGGRRKRLFEITATGQSALSAEKGRGLATVVAPLPVGAVA